VQRLTFLAGGCAAFLIAGLLATAPAYADAHGHPGGPGEAHEHGRGGHGDDDSDHHGPRFNERDRVLVREYYGQQFHGGHCPPGLAKKHNGCMPPGLARRWEIGRPLPRDVIFYDVPVEIVVRLSPPPVGYRYVRVASDLLLIAAGTGMVVDAIRDLGSL
jgi:Ni/Co efflux regulator RcnB